MDESESAAVYRFDKFVLDLRCEVLLTSDGQEVPIRAKSFALLRLLIENAGRVLGHDTIMNAIWPGVAVSDESIAQCIRDIRRTLGGNSQSIVRTVPRRGYLFSAALHQAHSRIAIPPSAAVSRPIIAILRFAQLNTDRADDEFCRGIAEELITELSCTRTLLVLPCHYHPRNQNCDADMVSLARAGGARYLLDGSVRQETARTRVIARLIELDTNTCIWAKRYDRNPSRLISVQDELACSISWAVEYAIAAAGQQSSLRGSTESLGPWELYQRGLWHLGISTPADNAEAARLFRQAIGLTPSYAAPHSALALTYFNEGAVYGSRLIAESMDLAVSSAQAAIKLDPDDPDHRGTLGIVRIGAGQVEEAWASVVETALPDGRSSPWACGAQGAVQLYAGQPGGGRARLLRSLQLAPRDPRNAILMTQVAISYYSEGDFAAAVETARRALARYPDYPLLYRWLAAALGELERPDDARGALHRARTISPTSFEFYVRRRPAWYRSDQYDLLMDGLHKAGWRA